MIENARRQAILVLLIAIAALVAAFLWAPPMGVDLRGGTQLIYEVPEDVLVDIAQKDPNTTPDQVMDQTVTIIAERIDPTGTIDALVSRRGAAGILIELPNMTNAQLASVEERIESLGKLEMRIVADEQFDEDGVKFDLTAEAERLQKWIDEQGGRELVNQDAKNIAQFNALTPDQGGILSTGNLLWFVRYFGPSSDKPELWDFSYVRTSQPEGRMRGAVAAFTDEQYNNGMVPEDLPEEQRRLIELVPINMKEIFFAGEDLEPSGVRPGIGRDGSPAVDYLIVPERQTQYADWSEKYKGRRSAIILNNIVKSAPNFIDRIPGRGQITGSFTNAEVQELVKVLRTGSLKVEPERQSKIVIGPTLGAASVTRGMVSILAGGVLVLGFILAYYRMAGIVAFIGIALNVALIWGIMMFLQATLTLPGIAGMVLTMGMAVDANILIYERIREERSKGKDMLQAAKTGFERAMVTILDSNITTFLAGVVLYNVGVGPIRGFAVTLMVGIVTTVFTAFFVSRLAFHYLLETKKLQEFRSARWLTNKSFNFIGKAKVAFTLSLIAITAGLVITFGVVPRETLLGLDFTGGANMQMVFEQSLSVEDVRDRLKNDPQFVAEFKAPQVNTAEALDADGKAHRFNVRIKLTEETRKQIEEDRRAARLRKQEAEAGQTVEDYVPPYLAAVDRVFGEDLVEPAFSGAQVIPVPENPAQEFAEITLHFIDPVSTAAVQETLLEKHLIRPVVRPENAEVKDLDIEWRVLAGTRPDQLFQIIAEALTVVVDGQEKIMVGGVEHVLSDPFPEAEEIGGRMVGELRNAAIGAMILALALIVLYIRIRFHEYKYGLAAVAALTHDVLIALGLIALFNWLGWVNAEINLAMIAAFLTIIGYSINDTIVIFDRIRENLSDQERLGDTKETFAHLVNRSINQTLSRTVLTSSTTMFVVLAQFVVNYRSGSALEGFSFALIIGIVTGTYSTMFIASPLVIWLRNREQAKIGGDGGEQLEDQPTSAEPAESTP